MNPSKSVKPDPGVFLVKGDKVSIHNLSFSVDDKGIVSAPPVELRVGIDMSPYWLDIAYQHVKSAENAHKRLMRAKDDRNDFLIGKHLRQESAAGMQAIVASGVAIDAYYASIREHITIPKATIKAWQVNRTARYKQIAETMRIGFDLTTTSSNSLRKILKQNLTFRDKAVHPCAGATQPLHHVELNKMVDWRYATFRFYNAKHIYAASLSIVYQTASNLSPKVSKDLFEHCNGLVVRLKPVLRRWERNYGRLF